MKHIPVFTNNVQLFAFQAVRRTFNFVPDKISHPFGAMVIKSYDHVKNCSRQFFRTVLACEGDMWVMGAKQTDYLLRALILPSPPKKRLLIRLSISHNDLALCFLVPSHTN